MLFHSQCIGHMCLCLFAAVSHTHKHTSFTSDYFQAMDVPKDRINSVKNTTMHHWCCSSESERYDWTPAELPWSVISCSICRWAGVCIISLYCHFRSRACTSHTLYAVTVLRSDHWPHCMFPWITSANWFFKPLWGNDLIKILCLHLFVFVQHFCT